MITRNNWKLTKAYLEYRKSIDQLSDGSLGVEETYIRHILEWADNTSFQKIYGKRPTLPEYLLQTRWDGKSGRVSQVHIKKTLWAARRFFTWLYENYPDYRSIKLSWINSLKPKRVGTAPKKVEVVTLDEIMGIAAAPADNLVEKRIKAAACFWYLSSIRIGAFVSLPIKAVDIENKKILQFPDLGVRTKNKKHATTTLYNIPALLAVVSEWDQYIRSILPEDGFWFAPFSPDTFEINPDCKVIGEHRENLARKNLKAWLDRVGLPYRSPHKFRHGSIQFAESNAKTVADLKAVSMNSMHSSMKITDEVYSQFSEEEVHNRIQALNQVQEAPGGNQVNEFKLFQEYKEFLAWRESKNRL
jgi:integrase